jgi:hypothetical protein
MTVSLGLASLSERVILDIVPMSIPGTRTVRKWFSIVPAAPLFSPRAFSLLGQFLLIRDFPYQLL